MSTEQNDLRDRYSKLETEVLIELYQRGTLTEVARPILESELRSRGISAETAASTKIEKEYKSDIGFKIEKEYKNDIGFTWWEVCAWLGLAIGNPYTLFALRDMIELAVILMVINSVLMVMILRFNKYAFLVATILSLNPLLWIINGIYLKRRWRHPKVNAQSPSTTKG